MVVVVQFVIDGLPNINPVKSGILEAIFQKIEKSKVENLCFFEFFGVVPPFPLAEEGILAVPFWQQNCLSEAGRVGARNR